jgi:predicted NBD/HSP70 family sugar kinase
MKNYIGFDVHCKKIAYVIQDESGKVIRHGSIETTRQGIEEFIRDKEIAEGTKIALESGIQSVWLVRMLSRGIERYGKTP